MGAGLRAPRAAGILSSLLLGLALILITFSAPSDPAAAGAWLADPARRRAVVIAANLVPFAGIAVLRLIGVARDRVGQREDRFFASVFPGSGLLFVAMLFAAAAFACGLIANAAAGSAAPGPDTLAAGRQVTGLLLHVYAMRMAAVFTITGLRGQRGLLRKSDGEPSLAPQARLSRFGRIIPGIGTAAGPPARPRNR
jgi:hypothetical protein